MKAFPTPIPDSDTAPFWEAVSSRQLKVQHCERCRRWLWLPTPVCPGCGETAGWEEVSGRARVLSWIVPHPPVLPAFAELLPYVVLLVELDEGPRMIGQLVDTDGVLLRTDGVPEGLAVGDRVELRWRDQEGQLLPVWMLAPD